MNRVIKFRGKRIDNGEWVYGYVDGTMYIDVVVIHTETGTFEVEPETVGQFTGIVDKNGNEIYEKDIIKAINYYCKTSYKQKTGYIAWLAQECGFVIVWKEYDSRLGHRNRGGGYYHDNSLEVIGNVFDNSELLKGGDND